VEGAGCAAGQPAAILINFVRVTFIIHHNQRGDGGIPTFACCSCCCRNAMCSGQAHPAIEVEIELIEEAWNPEIKCSNSFLCWLLRP
jgi:hypothetical protein